LLKLFFFSFFSFKFEFSFFSIEFCLLLSLLFLFFDLLKKFDSSLSESFSSVKFELEEENFLLYFLFDEEIS
jgi:hypothetical protein